MPFPNLRQELARQLVALMPDTGLTPEIVESEFSAPPNLAMGHVAFPCFRLAKILRKPADQIAKDIAARFQSTSDVPATASTAGPYANFRWDPTVLANVVLQRVAEQKDKYGGDDSGTGKRVVIEYCSPNMAKKLAFQHIRSTLIGSVLANVYTSLGYEVERMNFMGDWGTQFARLLAAFERWGDEKILAGDGPEAMAHLFELYVRFHKQAESDPAALEDASRWLQRLEDQDPKALALWSRIRDVSVESAERTLKRMNVSFDHLEGESHYVPAIAKTLEEVKAKANARLSDGAWIVEVPDVTTPALIQKKDGTTLYLTRDIAAAVDRFQRFGFARSLYVVSDQQRLHFQLLFGVLKLMGYEWADRCEHVGFGTVLFGAEKMSTREGRVIFLDDILDEAKRLALAECTAKNPELKNKETVAEQVGIGAILFGELSAHRQRDLEFDWTHILAFDGDTGPYVQYAAVRCRSLLEKAGLGAGSTAVANALSAALGKAPQLALEEEALVHSLAKLQWVLRSCVRDNEPYHLANFVLDVAKSFNRFYYRFPVLQATEDDQRRFRLALVAATRQTLENGLRTLGIACPEEM